MENEELNSDLESENEYLEEEEIEEDEYDDRPRRANAIFIVLMVGFFLTSGVLAWIWYQEKEINKKLASEQDKFKSERDSLEKEVNILAVKLDTLNGIVEDKDWELTELQKENENIKYQLSKVRSDKAKLAQCRAAVTQLKAKIEEYQAKITELENQNRKLTTDLASAQKLTEQQKEKNYEISNKFDKLNARAEEAAVLKALRIEVSSLDKKNKVTEKAKKVKSIKVKVTIGGNPLVDNGSINVYLRLVRSTQVLASSPDNLFTVDGVEILYSSQGSIDYVGEDEDINLKYSSKTELKSGAYTAEVYADGKKVGNKRFRLN